MARLSAAVYQFIESGQHLLLLHRTAVGCAIGVPIDTPLLTTILFMNKGFQLWRYQALQWLKSFLSSTSDSSVLTGSLGLDQRAVLLAKGFDTSIIQEGG